MAARLATSAFLLAGLILAAVPATHGQVEFCVPVETICASVTVNTGSNGAAGICQISINVDVEIVVEPATIAPAAITGVAGGLVTAIVPLPFIGIVPVVWSATPPQGCPGSGVPATCNTPCSFPNGGAAQGEPHFRGYDGSAFDFQGVAGDFYSIVTDEEHNVNGQFVKRGQRLSENGETWMDLPTLQDKATWLGAFGIIYKGDTVDMQRAEDHSVTVHVNGEEQNIGLDTTLPSGMMVSYLNTTIDDGLLWFKPGEWTLPQLKINTDRYEFTVSSPPNHSRRLDLTTALKVQRDGSINNAEGVLGRTAQAMIDQVGFLDINHTDIEEVWDAEEKDHIRHSPSLEAKLIANYQVSDLFASDARKSEFGIRSQPKSLIATVGGFIPETSNQTDEAQIAAARRRALIEIDPLPLPSLPVDAYRMEAGIFQK